MADDGDLTITFPPGGVTFGVISEQECVRHGGHCYERTGGVNVSNPPQYHERCKHCHKGRVAIQQEPFTYRDVP